jgi:hypothetical protein
MAAPVVNSVSVREKAAALLALARPVELVESGTLGFLDGVISYADLQRRFSS